MEVTKLRISLKMSRSHHNQISDMALVCNYLVDVITKGHLFVLVVECDFDLAVIKDLSIYFALTYKRARICPSHPFLVHAFLIFPESLLDGL